VTEERADDSPETPAPPPPPPPPRVWSRQSTYNNDDAISGDSLKSAIKVAYYQLFALLYGFCGAFAGARVGCCLGAIGGVLLVWWGCLSDLLVLAHMGSRIEDAYVIHPRPTD
jgi:hypothetical protein